MKTVLLLLAACLLVPAAPSRAATPSFQNDVLPVLTRFGCNSGGCHGKLAGQKGFKLSLRGYAPELDFEWLTRESRSRRVNLAAPELSLLLRKAVGDLPHGGGRRFEPDSRAFQTLADWIRAGAPLTTNEPSLVELEVTPAKSVMRVGETANLQVTARFDDGFSRDVTWLTRFDSNDSGVVTVTPEGQCASVRNGETVIRAAFQDRVAIATITIPLSQTAPDDWYSRRFNVIDGPVMSKLAALRIEPSPLCDDATFLRRAFLDTIGTLPTADEVRRFLSDTSPNKRAALVDHLLERPEFTDYWTQIWCDLLQNRKERDHDVRGAKGVRSFHAWLRQQIAAGRSWRDVTRDVLTSTGASAANPAIGYFIVTVGEKEAVQSDVTDSVAQAFLGTRIGCARCHNHPLEKYTQDDYYHFTAFFSRLALGRQDPLAGDTTLFVGTRNMLNLEKQLADQHKKVDEARAATPPDAKKIADTQRRLADLEKQLRDATLAPAKAAQPRTRKSLDPQPLDRVALVIEPGSDPRVALVDWMLKPDNELFAGAMVNRIWKHFFGAGMVEPVDDLRATNPPANSELWSVLTREFIEHNYAPRHLIRLILTSRTYQTASDTRPSNRHDLRFNSHYVAKRLPAEVLLDAICQVTGEPESFPGYPRGVRAIQVPDSGADSYFLTLFGRSPRITACACERENDVTLPQLLHLQNGDIGQKIAAAEGSLRKLLAAQPDNARAIDELFLATLSRFPSPAERTAAEQAVASGEDRLEAFTDLVWALLNAKEFAFNH